MDIHTVTSFRRALRRDDLTLAEGEVLLAGGTWLMSEPQPGTTGFVDLTTLGWPDLEVSDAGLRIGATCTIARLVAWARGPEVPAGWTAAPLVVTAVDSLLAGPGVWSTATVGGNVCRAYAAGALVSLAVALDGTAHVWTADGGEVRLPVAQLVTGDGTTCLRRGDVLRAVELPAAALRSRARLHRIALAELGRAAAVVTGRVDDDGSAVFGVTAATTVPAVLRFPALPGPEELAAAVADAAGYYTDPLGPEDWRRGVSVVLAERTRADLAAAA